MHIQNNDIKPTTSQELYMTY